MRERRLRGECAVTAVLRSALFPFFTETEQVSWGKQTNFPRCSRNSARAFFTHRPRHSLPKAYQQRGVRVRNAFRRRLSTHSNGLLAIFRHHLEQDQHRSNHSVLLTVEDEVFGRFSSETTEKKTH